MYFIPRRPLEMSIELRDLVKVEKYSDEQCRGRYHAATLRFADGSVYIGDVVGSGNGSIKEISGKGLLRRRTEDGEESFFGAFVCGKLESQGRHISASGDVYEGGFSEGKREGKGKMTRSGADTVHGVWKNGMLCGPVTRIFRDGSVEKAMWKQGVKDPWTITRVIPSNAGRLIVCVEPEAFFGQGSRFLRWSMGVQVMDIRMTAARRLPLADSLTPGQESIKNLLFTGRELPRELVARLQRKLLEETNGNGILVDFPYTVEEAEMLKTWGYEVTACVVMHVDSETLAKRCWYIDHPKQRYREIAADQLEDKSAEVQGYLDEVSPLIQYYSDVYIPYKAALSEGSLNIRELERKLCA